MGAIDERKALERLSQSMRRIVVGAREATRPRPPSEGQAELPAGQQVAQGAPGAPSGPAV
jgi:hypothetical protein